MCGINGIFAFHYAANPINRNELLRTRDKMTSRGPDGSGLWVSADERVGFGHRRLSIIDLSDAGAQPMVSVDGNLVVTFNGEIYNYRELRRGLEAKGRAFRSQSDTEVLLHLYAEKGAEMVQDLRGMFAFAIWDAKRQSLFLARDPYGIKPLYYADDGWTFRFASQVKALVAGGGIATDPDPAGLVGFFLFGSVPEPFTTWRAIRSVPAGSTLMVDQIGGGAPVAYHSIASVYAQERKAKAASRDNQDVAEALRDSVRSHLVADVPVGAFLSAGVDSGALVGLMRDVGARDIQTITVGFAEFRGQPQDETPIAEEVAALYGTRHTTRLVNKAEFDADLPLILEAMDQPSIDGVNTWFVSKAAHELGLKVAISGLGGDELFGGYPSFKDIPGWVRAMALPGRIPLLGRLSRPLMKGIASLLGANPKSASLLELGGTYPGAYLLKRGLFMPTELEQVLDRDVVRDGLARLAPLKHIARRMNPDPGSGFSRVASLEASLYMRNQLLRDADWASMAHSLEVRLPLVDDRLLRSCARASPIQKDLLASAPERPLPVSVTQRKKTGFTTPVAVWMQEHVAPAGMAEPSRAATPWARDWARIVSGGSGRVGDRHKLPALA